MVRAKSYAHTLGPRQYYLHCWNNRPALSEFSLGNRQHRHTTRIQAVMSINISGGPIRCENEQARSIWLFNTNLNPDTHTEVPCALGMIDSRHQHHGFQIESTSD